MRSEGDAATENWSEEGSIAGSEDGGRGLRAEDCGKPPEASGIGKGKETDSPPELQRDTEPCLCSDLARSLPGFQTTEL